MSYEHVPEGVKHLIDGIAASITLGAFMGLITNVTTILTLAWVVIRLYETKTVQGWLGKKRRSTDNSE